MEEREILLRIEATGERTRRTAIRAVRAIRKHDAGMGEVAIEIKGLIERMAAAGETQAQNFARALELWEQREKRQFRLLVAAGLVICVIALGKAGIEAWIELRKAGLVP